MTTARIMAAALASIAAFLLGNSYAACLLSLPGSPASNLTEAAKRLPSFLLGHGPLSLEAAALATGLVAACAVPPFWLATAIVLHVIGVPPVCGKAASREARRRRISGGRGARRPSAARLRRRVLRSGTSVPAWGTRLENAGGGLDFPVFLPFRKPSPLKEWERKNAL